MADIRVPMGSPINGEQIVEVYVDQGDGTYAKKVATTGSGGGGGGDASAANQTAGNEILATIDADTGNIALAAGAVADAAVSNPASNGSIIALLKGWLTLGGALTESAPANDTASSGLNGRLQRIAQRLTSLIAAQPPLVVSAATMSSVSASATSQQLLAANAARQRTVIVNASESASLYLKFGPTASLTSYSYLLLPGGTYESPVQPVYTGRIDGIWSAAVGAARITEF